jgi:hypothetical protein
VPGFPPDFTDVGSAQDGNALIDGEPQATTREEAVVCHERLGVLLNSNCRNVDRQQLI